MKPLYAVFGNPIAHSLSPIIHQQFSLQTGVSLCYKKIEVPLLQFEEVVTDFFKQGGKGLNITLPFKERAYAMADVQSPRASTAGAANVLWMEGYSLHADNTDGVGLIRDLQQHAIPLTHKAILLLGAGGAARGIIGPLLQENPASLTLANRTFEKAQLLQQVFPLVITCQLDKLRQDYDLIINATSASFNDRALLVPQAIFSNHPFCYDLAYGKNRATPFVQKAKQLGCTAMDGTGMLIEQAAEAFFIWHGIRPRSLSLFK
jgi:shikimate dehydrogenase